MYKLFRTRLFICAICFFGCFGQTYCNDTNSIDSLKIQELFAFADSVFYTNPSLTISIYEEIISLSEDQQSLFEEKALAILKRAEILGFSGSLDKSMTDYQEVYRISQEHNFEGLSHSALRGMANIKNAWGNSAAAIEDMHKIIGAARVSKDSASLVSILNDVGILYNENNSPDQALPYLIESLGIDRDLNDLHGQAIVMNNLGNSYIQMSSFDEALEYYFKSLDIVSKKGLKFGMRENLSDIGKVYEQQGNWEIASQYYQQALSLSRELKLESKISEELLHLSSVNFNYQKYSTSIGQAKEALSLQNLDSKLEIKVDAHSLLSENYEAIGEFKLANDFRKKYIIYKDSLVNTETIERRMELEMRFQNEKKEAENIQLRLQQVENELMIKRRNILSLIIGAGFIIALGFLLFFTIQNEQKKFYNTELEEEVYQRTKELESALREVERFTYIASHDLKEPLRNISGFVSLIERNIEKEKPEKNNEYIQFVKKNTKQLHDLIQDILNYSSLNQTNTKERLLSLDEMILQYTEEHSLAIHEQKVNIQCKDETQILLPSTLYLALKNVISNGIKYNDKAFPEINISAIQNDGILEISIKDNGIGMDEKYFKKIFKMFTRLHDRGKYDGSGLGLAISKKVLDHFEGKVKIESEIGKGTCFIISIPIQDSWRSSRNVEPLKKLV